MNHRPYTLDNGFANDCLEVTDVCKGQISLPGLWEIPMYATFDSSTANGIHLMVRVISRMPREEGRWLTTSSFAENRTRGWTALIWTPS